MVFLKIMAVNLKEPKKRKGVRQFETFLKKQN